MPKRKNIKKILIIGAGPIVIGQACEFDYSGAQACKSLKDEGYEIVLINSNPATIMTDPELADHTYIEPITKEFIEEIIKIEKPDALLPTMGGQTALNVSIELFKLGILNKYNIQMIGANPEAIELAEDRQKFKDAMKEIGLKCPESTIVENFESAIKVKNDLKLPLVIRPSFTLGGTGGGVAYSDSQYEEMIKRGLSASPTNQILIEKSVAGWKEFEMEVVRDNKDNCIIVCSIENVDPMGVHTGDSITIAPALTLTDKEYQSIRDASIKVLRKIGVDTGGSNVQFAINPENGEINVIEMNPRVSRSSALASKATGFPIAKIAAKLAVGYTLDELKNDITQTTPASFEPTIDYVVTKIPRFTFEKFSGADSSLTTSMKSVGETMSIGRSFTESLQKGFSSLEYDLDGLDAPKNINLSNENILNELKTQSSQRLLMIGQALRLGKSVKEINKVTNYDEWFINQLKLIIKVENLLSNDFNKELILLAKQNGFSDKKIAKLTRKKEFDIRNFRNDNKIKPVFRLVDTCAGEFESKTPYLYSTYDWSFENQPYCEANTSKKDKVIILGGGPNRIGQGIEFDYCCVHAVYALKELGIETIMINCNPETVSTDFDIADKLYFEPVFWEHIYDIICLEKPYGVIVQLGGQTALKLAEKLDRYGVKIIGTNFKSLDLAEDRGSFSTLLKKNKIPYPEFGVATTPDEAVKLSKKLDFPILVRPSYVLGGQGMKIVINEEELESHVSDLLQKIPNNKLLLDHYLDGAIEAEADAICDGKNVYIIGIMEHIEPCGIHSGDSNATLPVFNLGEYVIQQIQDHTHKIALALKTVGLINIQYAIKGDEVYVIEANPRASRTVPFIAKAYNEPYVNYATKIMLKHKKVTDFKFKPSLKGYAIKQPVFSFNKFPDVNKQLGPEMKSTGESILFIENLKDDDFYNLYSRRKMYLTK